MSTSAYALVETVLYLGDMATLKANDSLNGTIAISPNAKNPRDLDIVLEYTVDGAHPGGEKREYRMYVFSFKYLIE